VMPEVRADFEKRYFKHKTISPGIFGRLIGVKPGEETVIHPKAERELRSLVRQYVDYHFK
jgi:hypothetical protein